MMGELPLSIAALTFNLEMVDLLLSYGARLQGTNSLGDTALHSLVRFAALYPEKTDDVTKMMQELHQRLLTPSPLVEGLKVSSPPVRESEHVN